MIWAFAFFFPSLVVISFTCSRIVVLLCDFRYTILMLLYATNNSLLVSRFCWMKLGMGNYFPLRTVCVPWKLASPSIVRILMLSSSIKVSIIMVHHMPLLLLGHLICLAISYVYYRRSLGWC